MRTIKKKLIKSFLCFAFLLIAMLLPHNSYAADAADNYMDITEYRSGDEYTYPTKRGYVFAGWYKDAEFKTALGENVKNGYAYAKFVDADVLTTKCQILADTQETDDTTDLKMVTTVDSLKYSSVGFRIQFATYDITKTTTNVYEKITSYGYKNSDEEFINYEPSYFSEDSLYFAAYTVTGFPMTYLTTDISVTPMWTTLDGTTVIGTAKTFNFKDAIKVYEGYVAKIEDTYYTSFAEAVVAADDNYTADVTVTLLTDVTYSDTDATTINNSSDNVITIEGNGNKVTTSSESSRIFIINKSAGSVAFENITFDHQATAQVIYISSNTTVELTDVNIYATNNASGVYEYSVIMFKASGSQEATLNLTRTHIVMENDYAGKSDGHGYLCSAILTNTSDQTSGKNKINITMNNSEIDVTAAEKRAGICLTYGTTGNIKLMNSKIVTKNNYAIYSRVKSTDTSVKAVANVTLLDNVVLTSLDDTYNIDYSAYGYGTLSIGEGTLNFSTAPEIAKVGETYYTSLTDAFTAASAYTKDVTVELLQNVSECTASCTITGDADNTVTFKGNGYTIGTTGSNRIFTVSKTAGTVEFENITFNHNSTNRFMRIDSPITIDFTDVNIYADSNATNDELILFATAWDNTTSTLNLTRTYIKMTVPDTNTGGTSDQGPTCGVISTGSDDQSYNYKTVNITMIDSEIDATKANNRAGICLRFTTTSNIKLVNSKITTKNNYAIFSRVRYNTDSTFRTSGKANITLSGDVTLESQTADYNVDYSSAGYGTLSVGEVEAYNQGNVKFVTSTNVAQIGDTYYTSLKSAIEYANASGADETIELLTDIGGNSAVDFAQLSINNENGQTITIDGNGHSITTSGTSNSIEVYQSSGTVELKDLTIYHNGTNALVRTRNAVTLKVTDVDIYATDGTEGVLKNYLFNISGEGTSYLTMSKVNVEAINSSTADSKSGVIRTGVDSTVTKTVYITMTDCNIDLEQATGRTGIMIMGSTTAFIDLSNTTIATMDTYAIRPNGQTLTYTGCTFSSLSDYYNQYPIEGCNAKIGNTCYSLKKALEVANASEDDVTITMYADATIAATLKISNSVDNTITIDGNGYTLGTTLTSDGTANHGFVIDKPTGAVTFKNMTMDHQSTKMLARIDAAEIVNFVDVDINATNNTTDAYMDALISINTDWDTESTLNLTRVNVTMEVDTIGTTDDHGYKCGVILTGGDSSTSTKTVNINMKDTVIDATKAEERPGICVTYGTTANITQTSSSIKTGNHYAIYIRTNVDNTSKVGVVDLTLSRDSVLTATNAKYNNDVYDGLSLGGGVINLTYSDAETAYTNRIILVSDTHYTPDGDTILGYSTSYRMTALRTDLNNFMASNYVDAVLTLGDLSTDNGTISNYANGYVYKYKTDVLDKLSCATNSSLKTYALPGNHDGYSDSMWNSVFGYNRRSYFTVGDNALFIMLDTYDVSGYSNLSAITSAGSDYTGVDVDWLETVVAKFPNRQIFLCSHYVDTAVEGTELQTFLSENDNVVCMFMGHDHGNNITLTESLANKFLVNVSAYSYKTKQDGDGTYNFNYFDAKWAWGFGVLEWNDEEVHYYHVKNPRTYVGVDGTVNYTGAIEDAFTKKFK